MNNEVNHSFDETHELNWERKVRLKKDEVHVDKSDQ